MERRQQANEQVLTQKTTQKQVEERPERRTRLQIEVLEGRVAPSAIWGD